MYHILNIQMDNKNEWCTIININMNMNKLCNNVNHRPTIIKIIKNKQI
jgi:hypothetical protein